MKPLMKAKHLQRVARLGKLSRRHIFAIYSRPIAPGKKLVMFFSFFFCEFEEVRMMVADLIVSDHTKQLRMEGPSAG
jgi:hypothetical protein